MATISENLDATGIETGPKCCSLLGLATISVLALFIIGCVGAAGAFPGSAIGWTVAGLGGGAFACILGIGGDLKKRSFELIGTALFTIPVVVVGVLGGAGVLSATQVGWGVVGSFLAYFPIACSLRSWSDHQITSSQSA